jgi:transcriptional regulator with XRE-family HTH domain
VLSEDQRIAVYNKLGQCIRQYRVAAKIKQDLLADYIGLTRVSIVNIEKGKQKVQIHTLLEISKYLQIPISSLLDPLQELLIDQINPKLERRIVKELNTDKRKTIDKVKEFVIYTKIKNRNK